MKQAMPRCIMSFHCLCHASLLRALLEATLSSTPAIIARLPLCSGLAMRLPSNECAGDEGREAADNHGNKAGGAGGF
eukprot:CAMPEP_0180566016 /NCGR_PEP_ID=MMETSP1037_2-20121125/5854_1 /TAXON_ID=632150 /ORGANISM="Azadinium spinosum, Strain 3D9" /LENGTH=76 /DNA_ID=CAMNT_0022583025 /DNA_START=237 /DNA_END=465 /DNA_ORIENTATION=+